MTSIQILRTLLEITVYSAVLFACIMIFKTAAKGKLSPTLSFVLWLLLITRLCVPLTVQSPAHLFTLPQEQQVSAEASAPVQTELAAPSQSGSLQHVPAQQEPLQQQPLQYKPAQASPQEPLPVLTVYDWIVLAWLAGACAFGVWTLKLSLRIAAVIRYRSVPAPAEIERIYESCRREMGIHKRPPLLVTQNLLSPALVVSARPTILLPCEFVKNAPPKQIRLALCHELAHYKSKDHVLCVLLRVLSVVYWFNPILWLAEKEIAADMETACDNRIVRSMQKEEKAYYANTILSMFSARAETPFILGLALPNTRRVAEKRIRGIYMKNKTKKGVKFAALLLAAVLSAACFTTACQPAEAQTPATASQAQAQGGSPADPQKFQQLANSMQTAAPSPTADNKYKKNNKLSDIVTVNYDADVTQPGKMPQASMKIRAFTEADVQKVVDYFFAGKQTNAPWASTKAQLQAEIDKYQKENSDAIAKRDAFLAANPWAEKVYEGMNKVAGIERKVWDPIASEYSLTNDDWNTYMNSVANVQSTTDMNNYWIKKDQQELKTAPDTEQKSPAVIKFENVNLGNVAGVESGVETKSDQDIISNQIKVWSENNDGTVSEVFSQKNINGDVNSRISYCRQLVNGNYTVVLNDNKPLTMPQDQAQKLAVDAVAAICPEMSLSGVSIGKYRIMEDNGPRIFNGNYTFSFTRSINGAPITYDSNGGYAYFSDNGDKETLYEQIQVHVDNAGIISMDWFNPYTDIQVTDPNAKVLSMQQAQQAFEKNLLAELAKMKYTGSKDSGAYAMDQITIDINKIQLGLTRITEKDGTYNLIPTWDFFGEAHAVQGGAELQFNHFGQPNPTLSLGTVNALDGSEIVRPGEISNW